MRDFKFLYKTKSPILESIFTEHELTIIREYCVDFIRREHDSDLLKYYPHVGLTNKTFGNGILVGIGINFYPLSRNEPQRIQLEIDIDNRAYNYVFAVKSVVVFSSDDGKIEYSEIYEEL